VLGDEVGRGVGDLGDGLDEVRLEHGVVLPRVGVQACRAEGVFQDAADELQIFKRERAHVRSSNAPAGEPLTIGKSDYDSFERLLGEIQSAYSAEDINALRSKVTPEMLSYFSEQFAENASRGVVNKVDNVRLEQGDLAEGWREGTIEYATVAMRFSLTDRMIDRASGRTIEGGESGEVTELWTFMRARGGDWLLSAIQQM